MEAPPLEPSRDPVLKAVAADETSVVDAASVVDSMDWVLVASAEHSEDFADSMGLHSVVVGRGSEVTHWDAQQVAAVVADNSLHLPHHHSAFDALAIPSFLEEDDSDETDNDAIVDDFLLPSAHFQ
jgi:hypothetical protein